MLMFSVEPIVQDLYRTNTMGHLKGMPFVEKLLTKFKHPCTVGWNRGKKSRASLLHFFPSTQSSTVYAARLMKIADRKIKKSILVAACRSYL